MVIISLAEFRAAPPGFERYALACATVVLDRLDGGIARILSDRTRLDADEAFQASAEWLDAYANSLYRSVKNDRGQVLAARLDAADSIRHLLELLFALDRRPRPYNKYFGPHHANGRCWPATAPLRSGRDSRPASRAQRSAGRVG